MVNSARTPVTGGNWKMNGTCASAEALAGALVEALGAADTQGEVFVAPPALHLARVAGICAGTHLVVAGQDTATEPKGAHTGLVSVPMLADCGARAVIVGHSECRARGEAPAAVGAKAVAGLRAGLRVIVCVGETLAQHRAGETLRAVTAQLAPIAAALQSAALSWSGIVLAYEPVWAIGTGLAATPEIAQHIHTALRAWVATAVAPEAAASLRILYGGSVKPENAAELAAAPDIDGFLVGGASLTAASFAAIHAALVGAWRAAHG